MKKIALLLLLLCALCSQVQAQDVIVKKDGSTIVCRVLETNNTSVFYQSWSNPNGPTQVIRMSEVANINYEKGKQEQVQQVENQYTPYIQNTGTGQYNDNALVAMYNVQKVPDMLKKANTYKWIGLIGGGTLIVGGLLYGLLGRHEKYTRSDGTTHYFTEFGDNSWYLGSCIVGGGLVVGGAFLWRSHQLKKKAEEISRYSLFENEFKFNGGSSLSAGIDLIKDNQFKTSTVGLGLRYNF